MTSLINAGMEVQQQSNNCYDSTILTVQFQTGQFYQFHKIKQFQQSLTVNSRFTHSCHNAANKLMLWSLRRQRLVILATATQHSALYGATVSTITTTNSSYFLKG